MLSIRNYILRRLPVKSISKSYNYNSGLWYSTAKDLSPKSDIQLKYQDKLLQEAKKRGLASVDELKVALKKEIEGKKKEFNKVDPLQKFEEYMRNTQSQNTIKKEAMPFDPSIKQEPFKTLDSYVKLDKIKELSRQECEYLWRTRWSKIEDSLHAVIPSDVFERMITIAKQNPMFVLPLPREANISEAERNQNETPMELQYVQWIFVGANTIHCIITSLAEYKAHGTFSRPHTTLEFHTELSKDKGFVLMNGHVETRSGYSLTDAHLLLLNIQRFWGATGSDTPIGKQRVNLLKQFTTGSTEFSVDKLIALAQSTEI
ncbi:hypothetical protein TBLA_0B08700 [Henningerozyma blattae CBS 6284]|uniref:ATP synthase mitochondrial F1 complex assembly factor 1 n=1 Tax=Henningerozyma blattae (strain ATCC 34711 / CBS 6284 / DSM 70876 / NBRC 10599 / NRRL Y-10934 / UCD 77-7) TaxID=1071380 RepID=I2GZY3_HENB6|nr:hypothetical protein TBLA_0B08700 [Tetrapisispora blattae CBS 6284]CCH59685.1 hypothetical protein TBLA_0B08700 [Tetrapisispora blattae CBS 6284]